MGQCPSHIQTLITLANLTGKHDLIDLGELWLNLDPTQDTWAAAEQVVAGLPPEFRDYIGPVRFETRQTFVPLWDGVYRARRTLAGIIDTSNGPVGLSAAVRPQVAELRRDGTGKLKLSLSADMEALAGLPATRLARCRQCEKFLWMSRVRPQPLCSDACRQAKWREDNPEKYREAQIENERKRAEREARRNALKPSNDD
jgi:hypothetical protein